MTSAELAVSTALPFDPARPAPRVYIQGLEYKLVGPRFVHPQLAGTVKLIWNWLLAGGKTAKNIMYAQFTGGAPTSDSTFLKQVANAVMNSVGSAALLNNLSSQATLNSVTARDNGLGTGAQIDSDHAPLAGVDVGPGLPPQVAITVSWKIDASYRGGKPRTYLPGVTNNALVTIGVPQIKDTVASQLATAANNFTYGFNASSPGGHDGVIGTISYQSGHSPRPTPLFRPFTLAEVHERLDSQRRRSGKESAYGEAP